MNKIKIFTFPNEPFPKTLMNVKSVIVSLLPDSPAGDDTVLLVSSMADNWEDEGIEVTSVASELSDTEIDSGFFFMRKDILSPVKPSWANSRAICLAFMPQLFATLRWHLKRFDKKVIKQIKTFCGRSIYIVNTEDPD